MNGLPDDVAVPAGMVPWHGGDSAPADWNGGPVLFRNGFVTSGIGSSWSHPWAKGVDGEPEMDGATTPYDIVAYTPVAALQPQQGSLKPAEDVERVVNDRADWLLDAVACATQDRRFLRGDATYDAIAGEAILMNGAKAIRVAITRLSTPSGEASTGDEDRGCTCHGCKRRYTYDLMITDADWQAICPGNGEGMLCGGCIIARLEALRGYGVLHATPSPSIGDADRMREAGVSFVIREARKTLAVVQGCMECNAEDERRWMETIRWLEGLA